MVLGVPELEIGKQYHSASSVDGSQRIGSVFLVDRLGMQILEKVLALLKLLRLEILGDL